MKMADDAWSRQWLKDKKAVIHSNRGFSEKTLRDRCLDTIIRNRHVLCKSRLKNLPSVLRTDLLQLATWRIQSYTNSGREDVPDWKEVFSFLSCLLHSRVPSFQLPTGFIWSGNFLHEYTPLLEAIGAECGNLMVLKGKTCYNSALDLTKDYMTTWHGPAIFRLVSQLTSLQVVLMETYTCDNWSLHQFAKHAPNLRVLRIHLSGNVSGAGFKALSKLLQLREFLFGENMEDWELEQKCVMWSVKLIPQLSLVGRRYDVSNFDSNAQLFKYHNAVTRLRRPIELGLEELVLNGTVRLSLNVHLCKVRAVHWYMPDGGDVLVVGLLKRFPDLTELGLYRTEASTIMLVLQQLGQRLSRLTLLDAHQKLKFSEVLRLCPNLQMLHVHFCYFEDCSDFFAKSLQELSLHMFYKVLSPGFIFKLLSAPMLKKVELHEAYLTRIETEELMTLAKQRPKHLLPNIETFSWENFFENVEMEPRLADRELFELMLDTVQVAFPHIQDQFGQCI